jgi:beta-lactamase regulating signal transducer with metallopeptidase domain
MPVVPAVVPALGWSLLHFLWQGAAVALALACLDPWLRRASPVVRYRWAAAALLLMTLLPAATFQLVRGTKAEAVGSATAMLLPARVAPAPPLADSSLPERVRRGLDPLLPLFVAGWAIGVAVLSLRGFGGWALTQRLRRSGVVRAAADIEERMARLARRIGVRTPVGLRVSRLVEVPTVIGVVRPLILLPAGTLLGLSPDQLELILAHELAHVRRADYLANLLQTAAETLLFYHPAVWWVSNRMRVEREHCCDDLAVDTCGDPAGYARALAELEAQRSGQPSFAMAATGGSLLARIARLAGAPQPSGPRGRVALLGAGALAATVTLGVAATGAPSAAQPREFPRDRILEMARAGVTPEYADEMATLGYPTLDPDALIELRSHGVDPEYVRGLKGQGLAGLSTADLVELRCHGIDPEFVAGMTRAGYGPLSVMRLVELRNHGIAPDWIAELKALGYADLSVTRLIALRRAGVDPEYIGGLAALGYRGLDVAMLIGLRSHGVDPEYVRGLKQRGYSGLAPGALVDLRSHGVDPDFIGALQQVGYSGLAPDMLVELRSHGVDADFVRELKKDGVEHASPEELIRLRSGGGHRSGGMLERLRSRIGELLQGGRS